MRHNEINKIVESAIMVVGGYAFIQMDDGNVQILGFDLQSKASFQKVAHQK